LTRPHDTTADSPSHTNSFRLTFAPRFHPFRATALPSRRVKTESVTENPTLPSTVSAAVRATAQSPPEGIPCGAMKLGAAPVKMRPERATSEMGDSGVPDTLMRQVSKGTSNVHDAGGGVPALALWT
jgi:hypothetical protein